MRHGKVVESFLFKGFELANWPTFSANLACTAHAAGDDPICDLCSRVAVSVGRFVAVLVDAHTPGWAMASKGILLEFCNCIIAKAGKIIIGFIVLAHMVDAEV